MTKDRPILFTGEMVRPILEGRKTQTRRVMMPQPPPAFLARGVVGVVPQWPMQDGVRWFMADGCSELVKSPYGKPGDRLIVKEAAWMWCERKPNGKTKTGRDKWHYVPMREANVFYCAEHPDKPALDVVSPVTGNQWGWRKKIGRFLPRWASRITLEIVSVKVERVQDISEEDALAEGVNREWLSEKVDAMASKAKVVNPYWMPHHAVGEEGEFCLSCGEKRRKALLKKAKLNSDDWNNLQRLDGGWCCESDSGQFCNTCGKLLAYSLTDYGCESEWGHFREHGFSLTNPNEAYQVQAALEQSQIDGINGMAYRTLWDSINSKRGFGWETNPWVWVVEFRRVKE